MVEFVRLFHDQHDRLLSFEHEVPEFSLTKLGLFGDLQLPGGQETCQEPFWRDNSVLVKSIS